MAADCTSPKQQSKIFKIFFAHALRALAGYFCLLLEGNMTKKTQNFHFPCSEIVVNSVLLDDSLHKLVESSAYSWGETRAKKTELSL